MEVLKIILGVFNIFSGCLLLFNVWDMKFWELKLCFNFVWLVIEKLIDYD